MLRRIAIISSISTVLVALAVVPAFGWGNGPYDGNGYGTHDWVLEHAIRTAGGDTSWIDVDAALLASDDPDYGRTATPGEMHSYKNTGPSQAGPQAVADEYFELMNAYNRGDYADASRHLGVMSHYYSDICQPYHSDSRGSMSINNRHFPYEIAVSDITRSYSAGSGWLTVRGRKEVSDVRSSAVDAALYARSMYVDLDASLRAHDGRVSGDAYTSTGRVLDRATNDLADIIRAVPQGNGLAQPPAVMKQRMQRIAYYYPRKGTHKSDMVRSEVICSDASGRPMRGVAVTFVWPLSTAKSYVAYTDSDGLAYSWQAPGYGISLMKKRLVVAKTVLSSRVATSATWFMPTPVLADSKAGMKTTVSTHRPKRGTVVKATTRVRDAAGRPVAGLPVTFSWCFRSKTLKVRTYTNASGYAFSSKNIGGAAKGYRVYVKGRVYSGRHTRNGRASFIPQ